MFKNLSRAFVIVSLCALFTTAVASKPAPHLSRESLERRILNSAAAGTRMLKQFDVRHAPRRDNTHARRQASAAFNEFVAAATQTQASPLVLIGIDTQTATAPAALKTGLASREVDVDAVDTEGLPNPDGFLLNAFLPLETTFPLPVESPNESDQNLKDIEKLLPVGF